MTLSTKPSFLTHSSTPILSPSRSGTPPKGADLRLLAVVAVSLEKVVFAPVLVYIPEMVYYPSRTSELETRY